MDVGHQHVEDGWAGIVWAEAGDVLVPKRDEGAAAFGFLAARCRGGRGWGGSAGWSRRLSRPSRAWGRGARRRRGWRGGSTGGQQRADGWHADPGHDGALEELSAGGRVGPSEQRDQIERSIATHGEGSPLNQGTSLAGLRALARTTKFALMQVVRSRRTRVDGSPDRSLAKPGSCLAPSTSSSGRAQPEPSSPRACPRTHLLR